MIKNIDFRNLHSKFQKKSKHDITEIRNSIEVTAPADKTLNLYKIKKKIILSFYPRIL